jgi:hypothetical protein
VIENSKIETLIKFGVENNLVVFDGEDPGQFSRKLVYLMKRHMYDNYNDNLNIILVPENDCFYDLTYNCGVYFWENTNFTIDGVVLTPITMNMTKYYSSISDMFPRDTKNIVLGIGKNENVIIGAY